MINSRKQRGSRWVTIYWTGKFSFMGKGSHYRSMKVSAPTEKEARGEILSYIGSMYLIGFTLIDQEADVTKFGEERDVH